MRHTRVFSAKIAYHIHSPDRYLLTQAAKPEQGPCCVSKQPGSTWVTIIWVVITQVENRKLSVSDINTPITAQALSKEFAAHFPGQPRLFRAPARVNIIGEHTDYNDGLVLPTTTALYTWLAIAKRTDRILRVYSCKFDSLETIDLDRLEPGGNEQWFEYVKGVAAVLQQAGYKLNGADIVIDTDIPLGGGLSSSASMEVALGFALLDCAQCSIDPTLLATLCQRAEVEFVGVGCGIMDQYAIACSDFDQGILLDCRSMEARPAPLLKGAGLLIVDSGVKHQLPAGDYNARGEECAEAVALLSAELPEIRSLRDLTSAQLEAQQQRLGDRLFRRCRHVVTEIERVRQAFTALVSNDAPQLAAAINNSHASLRDDYEVGCAEVEKLVEVAMGCTGVLASRMMGAGFGGCTISLVETARMDQTINTIKSEYGRFLGRPVWTHIVKPTRAVESVGLDDGTSAANITDQQP